MLNRISKRRNYPKRKQTVISVGTARPTMKKDKLGQQMRLRHYFSLVRSVATNGMKIDRDCEFIGVGDHLNFIIIK